MTRVSVVVPTRNRADLLPGLLGALDRQTLADYEVIVVDDASTDETPHVLAGWVGPGRRSLRLEQPSGSYAARNLGWRAAAGEIIAFTDDDCVPSERWLEAVNEAFAGSDIVGVQGVTLAEPGAVTPFTHQIDQRRAGPPYRTCNIAYHRSVLARLNGFEPLRWYADNIFGLRARRLGPIGFSRDAIVYHPPRRRQWRDREAWLARFEADAIHRRRLRELGEERVSPGAGLLPIVLWVLRPLVKQSAAHARYLLTHPARYLREVSPMVREKRELLRALRMREKGSLDRPDLPPLTAEPVVSVVVVTRGRPAVLEETLQALDRQDYPWSEVIVVDHAPEGSAWETAHRHGARWIPARGTLGAARQTGVDAASGEVVAFTDDDCLPVPTWLRSIVRDLTAQPRLRGVQGPTVAELGNVGSHAIRVTGPDRLYRTCNIAYRRDALEIAGGFDRRFGGWFEDTALGARVESEGVIGWSPEMRVVHRAMPRRWMTRAMWSRLLADERLLRREYPRFYREVRGPGFLPVVVLRWMIGSPVKTLWRELPRARCVPAAWWQLLRRLAVERLDLVAALVDFYGGETLRSAPASDIEGVPQAVAEK